MGRSSWGGPHGEFVMETNECVMENDVAKERYRVIEIQSMLQ